MSHASGALTPRSPTPEAAGVLARFVAATVAAALLLGCEAGPGDAARAMGLREALLSTPEQVAALPLEERMSLALRMEAAASEQRASTLIEGVSGRPSTALLEDFDAPRALEGEDAVVVLAVAREPTSARMHTLQGAGPDAGAPEAPELELVPVDPALRDDPYARALAGPAREPLQRMASETGAREVRLGEPMAAGLLGDGDALVVNPSWLTLLATLDAHEEVGRASARLIEPAQHHRTESTGWGCYGNVCTPTTGSCGWPCTCSRYGCDCGECAYECGPGSDGAHCAAARRAPPAGSPLDPVWMLLPVAYLWLRRRR